MKSTPSIGQTLCLKYCSYYKPGKNEELACRCFLVVEQLMRSGKAGVPASFKKEHDPSTAEAVVQEICAVCDFNERDCDFMLDRAAPPCGGMVILTQLLQSEQISLNDLVMTNRKIGKKSG
jgi:hypothetical protein